MTIYASTLPDVKLSCRWRWGLWLAIFPAVFLISNMLLAQEFAARDGSIEDDHNITPSACQELARDESCFDWSNLEVGAKESSRSEFAMPLMAVYDDGFGLRSLDDEYRLKLRFLTQIDGKVFTPTEQEPARGGMYIPRFRTYFEGQLTDRYEYELSLQRSVEGTFDLLDANINFRPSEAFQIRIGRSITPYSYAWYDHLEQFYITPERGLLPLNFGLARQVSVLVHGKLAEQKFEYSFGPTFGHISGLADTNATREGVGYINMRPFLESGERSFLKYLNLGGSIAIGTQSLATSPLPLRTSLQTSENDEAAQAASTIFLEYNDGVLVYGDRMQGALHVSNYVGPLSIEAEFYALTSEAQADSTARSINVPVTGFDATVGWFITGEQVTGRGSVDPLRPYGVGTGGQGAIELFGRYSQIDISERIFSFGLADEADWTRRAAITDLGFNWYPNRFVKMVFDWQHSLYATPVLLNAERDLRSRTSDLFWLRCQLYF